MAGIEQQIATRQHPEIIAVGRIIVLPFNFPGPRNEENPALRIIRTNKRVFHPVRRWARPRCINE